MQTERKRRKRRNEIRDDAKNAHVRLRERETKSDKKNAKIYSEVPLRLQAPIERVLDKQRKLLRVVILGLTADGEHIVAHDSRGGLTGCDHSLQFWTFDVHGNVPAKLVREIPVLRERDGSSVRATQNARAVVVSFAQSPCENAFFANFQVLRKREDSGEDTRPEQVGYFC